ncbi:MAG: biotin--[acetyl-CoA-carboxylase] ligase [Arenibacter sp.]|nr:biotin--[acetyl-CoA-carboxylase] ligase [Arenibacter sp.]
MQLIKLSATESTNAYLKDLMQHRQLVDFTVVTAKKQTKGRGQMGTSWISESGKNLTFSVLKRYEGVTVAQRFWINISVSLAIHSALEQLEVPSLRIKWPNDIMSGRTKICGILIENILSGQLIHSCIIGIGLNVNQLNFQNLPKVSSLKLLLGREFDLEKVLLAIIDQLKKYLKLLEEGQFKELGSQYEVRLFRKGMPTAFKNKENQLFMGMIQGVSRTGKLLIQLEDDSVQEFDLKEVQLMY